MELSDEKTLITHSTSSARFLGYDVRVRRNQGIKKVTTKFRSVTKRTMHNQSEMLIPIRDKIEAFLFKHRIVEVKNGELSPVKRGSMIGMTDLEIVSSYNAELRGIYNYYNLASNFCDLNYFGYLMEYSCLKNPCGKTSKFNR